jgi:Protein of Unknown function (DUF2784)
VTISTETVCASYFALGNSVPSQTKLYSVLADTVLVLHLIFITWIIFGAAVTARRPLLRGLHLSSLIWGMLIEIMPWTCPLTWAENWLESQAGIAPYQGGFVLHYLDALVYPNVPAALLTGVGIAVCIVNLGIYALRFRRRRLGAW